MHPVELFGEDWLEWGGAPAPADALPDATAAPHEDVGPEIGAD